MTDEERPKTLDELERHYAEAMAGLTYTFRREALHAYAAAVRAEAQREERERCLRAVNIASLSGPWELVHQEAFKAAADSIAALPPSPLEPGGRT